MRGKTGFWMLFLTGGLVGAALTLLLTPWRGPELLERIQHRSPEKRLRALEKRLRRLEEQHFDTGDPEIP